MRALPNKQTLPACLDGYLADVAGRPERVAEITALRGKGGAVNQLELQVAAALAQALAFGANADNWVIGSCKMGRLLGTRTCTMTLASFKCDVTLMSRHAVGCGKWPMNEPYCIGVDVLGQADA